MLGICSLVFFWSPLIGIVCSILGLVFGILGKKKQQGGMAMAGIITGSIGLALSVIVLIAAICAVVGVVNGALNGLWSDFATYY